MKQVLTTGDIAKYCNVNLRTVIRWIERGHLKAHKLPGRGDNRVQLADFIAFLSANDMPLPEELAEQGRRILVVEDDPTTAMVIQKMLEKEGFTTEIATDGFRAGMLISSFRPRLITLDLDIPGLNGFQVLQYVRESEDPWLQQLKVLVVSGQDRAELDKALARGADEVLEKPARGPDILAAAHRLLGD